MESQCCNVVPTDNGFDMYPSTQHMDNVQAAAAAVLNLPANKYNSLIIISFLLVDSYFLHFNPTCYLQDDVSYNCHN